MTRAVSSGTTNNGDVVFFYDDAAWALFGGSLGSFSEVPGTPPPSDTAPAAPQASNPGAAIGGGGDTAGSFLGENGILPAISVQTGRP